MVTHSDPERRVVHQINGEPAAQVYAGLLGVPVASLDEATFAMNPLIFQMGGEHYVRAIARANEDQSLSLYCAIENGLILDLGRAVDPLATAQAAFARVRMEIGEPALILGCDCYSRRVQLAKQGLLGPMDDLLKQNRVFSFSTCGEQFDGLHMNQTFTGVAIALDHAGS